MSRERMHRLSEPALFGVALAMAVLLGILAAPFFQQPARAEMVSQTGHLVAMTAAGGNEDILFVIDNRTEQLTAYRIRNQNSMQMLQRLALPQLFESARARSLGRQ